MPKSIRVEQFIRAIHALPSDAPRDYAGKWYRTQKEHWLGWLSEYDSQGAYGRQPGKHRDACFAYNHIVDPEMLLWLVAAAGVAPELIAAARCDCEKGASLMQKSAAIRRNVPWSEIVRALWGRADSELQNRP